MRIRNTRQYDLYLPYAGKRRGFVVKAGKLSMELPTDRFYDQLLQRDWKGGKVEILLSDADKSALGPSAHNLPSETVEITKDSVVPQPASSSVEAAGAQEDTTDVPESSGSSTEKGDAVSAKPVAKEKPKVIPKQKPIEDSSIKTTAKGVRLYNLAKEIGVTSRAVLVELRRRGVNAKSASMNIEPELAESLREHFEPAPPTGAPSLTSDVSPEIAGRATLGMPTVSPSPGTPSLADLQEANASINLDQPKRDPESGSTKATIETPTTDLFGSTLTRGVPQATAEGAD